MTVTVFPTGVFPQADTGDAEMATAAVAKSNDTPQPEPDVKEGGFSMPPNLEEFIPGERLPDILDVYLSRDILFTDYVCASRGLPTPQLDRPLKFVRLYPPRTAIDKDVDGPDRDCPKKMLTGQLDLRFSDYIGSGNHSQVLLASLTFPSTTPKPSVCGAVAVKIADLYSSGDAECKMLLNEAKIYNAFPHELQGGDVPVVPKFYGCYAPCIKVSDRVDSGNGSGNLDNKEWTREMMPECPFMPILLLEACGNEVWTSSLSRSSRESIGILLKRLHEAKFVQGSMYERNVLVQPGPLTVPPANRSFNAPSYRIIDFGRGINLGANKVSLKDLERGAESEKSRARSERLIL